MPILPPPGLLRRFLLPALLLSAVPAAIAQLPTGAVVQPLPSDSDPAELLARALRTLAAEPNNVQALTAAGHNALVLGDANAAVGFFGRAQEMAPRDGRVKAGLGSALVQLEKPQDALRLFNEASRLGVPDADIAEDRGLAYDLTGDPRKAQRDYATVLAAHPEDDTARRRLALSQGISGDKAAALATLDPLIRKRDIAGWRAQTFVLAMTGDAKGASDITRIMMPQQSAMLQPFLVRLPTLSAADKAKAVHFGEMPAAGRNYSPTELSNIGTPPTYASAPALAQAPAQAAPRSDLAPLPAAPTRISTVTQTPLETTAAPATTQVPAATPTVAPNTPALAPIQTLALPPSAPLLAQAAGTTPATAAPPPPPDLSGMPMPATEGHYDLPHVAADRRGGQPFSAPRTVGTPVVHGSTAKPRSADEEEDCTIVKVVGKSTRHHKGKVSSKTVCKPRGSEGRGSARSGSSADEDCTTIKVAGKSSRHHKGKATTKTVCKPGRGSDDSGRSSARSSSGADEDCTTVKVAGKSSRHHKGKATTKTVCKPSRSSDDTGRASVRSSSSADQDCTTVKVPGALHHGRRGKATTKTVCKASRGSDDSSKASSGSSKSGSDATSDDCTTVKVPGALHHGHRGKATTKTVCKPSRGGDDSSKASSGSSKSDSDATSDDCTTVKVLGALHHGHRGKAITKTVCKSSGRSDDSKASGAKGDSGNPAKSSDADEDCKTVKVAGKSSHGHAGKATTKQVCKAVGDDSAKGKTSTRSGKSSSDDADDSGPRAKASAKGKASSDEDGKASKSAAGRVYVQVAGGANKADLDKAWAGVKKKAPDLMKGHTPSTTSARATNRLMVGPFKSDEEAQAFVNKMAGKGVSGFVVKTDKGQKVEKVDAGQ
jgi:Flp pilus assembly protein TadD